MNDQNSNKSQGENQVLTPGGRRPRKLVHFVRAGDAVRFDEKGKFSIIHPIQPIGQERSHLMAQNLVLTPGGYRNRQLVHHLAPGHVLQISRKRPRIYNPEKKVIVKIPQLKLLPGDVPGFGEGWITYAYWTNNTGNPVSSFRTTWRVPRAPSTSSGQTIFIFNGIDPSDPSDAILQPVLQWGESAAGGGPYWSVASWYVLGDGTAIHTDLVPVNENDNLIGRILLTDQHGNSFDYTAEFEGINNTLLQVQNVDELVWCNETLEAYDITACTDYPSGVSAIADYTGMREIQIETGEETPELNWTAVDRVTDCGQHTTIVSNSATDGEVDIHYRAELEIAVIEGLIGYLREDIRDLLAHEDWEELIKILHFPGWTTPAEFLFASAILSSMRGHTQALITLKKQLIGGSRAVIQQ